MSGVIGWFVRNGVATNLLMLSLLAAGGVGFLTMGQMIFPEFSLDRIEVRVRYPGASPEEVEAAVVQPIEEAIRAIEGVRELFAVAGEGVAVVTAELADGEDVRQRLEEIRAEVERITTLPEEAERPEVRELSNRQRVIELVVYGDIDEAGLRELAFRIKDDLAALPAVSFTQVTGVRDYEMAIEFHPDRLRELDLSLGEASALVRAASLELPGGRMVTPDGEILARTLGRNLDRQDFEQIVVRNSPDGGVLRLRELATVRDGFRDEDLLTRYDGRPAAFVQVFRVGEERLLALVAEVERYLEEHLRPELPEGVAVHVWRNDAEELEKRLELLLKNGSAGLILVLLALTLFLDIRLAFFIAVSIFVSFVATGAVMSVLGLSINQLSLFAFILAIGIVVDAAIVTGENIYSVGERGVERQQAAVDGARRITVPVMFAVTTTMVAFSPLMVIPGPVGKFFREIPQVVIIVLAMSLIAALLILPWHLSRVDWSRRPQQPLLAAVDRVRAKFAAALANFTEGPLRRWVGTAMTRPLFTLACALVATALAIGLVTNGLIRGGFFPLIEGRYVSAELELEEGTPARVTEDMARLLLESATATGEAMAAEYELERSPVSGVAYSVGRSLAPPTPLGDPAGIVEGHRASVVVELIEPELRPFSSERFEARWRDTSAAEVQALRLRYSSRIVDLGAPIQVQLAARDAAIRDRAADELVAALTRMAGVHSIRDDRDAGKRELRFQLTERGRVLGFSTTDLARQVRAALFGDEALRVQRGRDEVRVLLRLDEETRASLGWLEQYRIKAPGGSLVPLADVAEIDWARSPASIRRRDGQRVVTVSADVDAARITGQQVNERLAESVMPALVAEFPGLSWQFAGEQREQGDAFGALALAFPLALFFIYALLAVPFRSYLQPVIVMAVIPLGLIGALFGHLLLGLPLTVVSIFGIVGLAGVIINGSLVMIDFINEEAASGRAWEDAVLTGALGRFRPILLTALTTFLGVAPLIFERSIQAQFLIPLAVSIGFGVLVGTAILMFVVPALCMLAARRSAA